MLRTIAALVLFAASALIVSSPARAQAPERRIAFVVGNESYADGALPTAANDAGLIAQTLQAAGFEVVGARDLDAETLRESYAEFLKRLADAGPDAVAFVYLAGYGLQYGNDNFFVPIGARLANDTDIPMSAVRLNDLAAPLVNLPLKARFFVYDAAYVLPFRLGGAPLAGGFALVEPGAATLIGFNAAPGPVAPAGKQNYGFYAQSLAAELRVGGLTSAEIFYRVRLRVSEVSQGAEVPWDASSVDPEFRFLERGPDAPPSVAGGPAADAMMRRPLRDLPPRQAYPAALARDTVRSYDEFIEAYPDDPLARRARVLLAARREALTWQRSAVIGTPAAYWSYLRRYPRGPHAQAAQMRLRQLAVALEPPANFDPVVYDVPPPPPDELVYVDRPVVYLADPAYGLPPPPPPPVGWVPDVPREFVELPPPPRSAGLFQLPVPAFVPLPVFFNPPRNVAVPRDNRFFAAPGGFDRRQVLGARGVGIDIHRWVPAAGAPFVPLPGAAAQRATVLESRGIRTPEQLRDVRGQPGGLNRVLSGPTREGLPAGQRLPGAGGRPLPPGGVVQPLPPTGPRGPGPGVVPDGRGPIGVRPEERGRLGARPRERGPERGPVGGRGPGGVGPREGRGPEGGPGAGPRGGHGPEGGPGAGPRGGRGPEGGPGAGPRGGRGPEGGPGAGPRGGRGPEGGPGAGPRGGRGPEGGPGAGPRGGRGPEGGPGAGPRGGRGPDGGPGAGPRGGRGPDGGPGAGPRGGRGPDGGPGAGPRGGRGSEGGPGAGPRGGRGTEGGPGAGPRGGRGPEGGPGAGPHGGRGPEGGPRGGGPGGGRGPGGGPGGHGGGAGPGGAGHGGGGPGGGGRGGGGGR